MNIPEDDFKEIEHLHGIFLQEEVQLIRRGQAEIAQYAYLIPISWTTCLEQEEYSATSTRAIWAQVDRQVPRSVDLFFTRVVDIGLAVSPNKGKVHGLTYLLKHQTDKGDFYEGWLGRLPATHLTITTFEEDTNLSLPQSYEVFCGLHNGFLQDGNGAIGYMPIHELIAWKNALGFCGDGAGNLQVYDLTKPLDNNDYLTADWDHEVDELSHWMSFWEFVEKQFVAEFR